MRPVILIALVVAACAPAAPPTTREQACALHADDDPAVRQMIANSAETEWAWQNSGKLEIVKQQAIARCVAGRGGVRRGGVERPQ